LRTLAIIACFVALIAPIVRAARPATGILVYPLAHNINPDEGTIEFWIKPLIDADDYLPAKDFQGLLAPLMLSGEGGGFSTSYFVGSLFGPDLAGWHVRFTPQSKMLPLGHGVNWHKDQWHHMAITWRGRDTHFYVDGKHVSTRNHPTTFSDVLGDLTEKPTIPKWPFYFGDQWNVGAPIVIDDVRLSWVERQPEELGFNGPLAPDPYTALLDNFDQPFVKDDKRTLTQPAVIFDGAGGWVLNNFMRRVEGRFGQGLCFQMPDEGAAIDKSDVVEATAPTPAAINLTSERHPFLTIPRLPAAPQVDGRVETREWFSAAEIGYLLDETTGNAIDLRSTVRAGHTEGKLCIAFRFDRPSQNLEPSDADRFEVRLHQDAKAPIVVQVNLAGVASSTIEDVTAQSTMNDTGWEGELLIPIPPGAEWRMNVSRLDQTPRVRTARWSYPGRFAPGLNHDGRIALIDETLAVTVNSGWLQRYHQAGQILTISNFTDNAVTIEAMMRLRRAPGNIAMPLLPALDDETTDDLGQPNGKPVDQSLARLLEAWPVVDESARAITVAPHTTARTRLTSPDDPGEYIAITSVTTAGKPLAHATVPFVAPDHLGLAIRPFLLSKAIEYDADLRRLRSQLTDTTSLDVSLFGESAEPIAANHHTQLTASDTLEGVFQFDIQPASKYRIRATLREGDRVLASREAFTTTSAQSELPDWWTMDHGREPLVPPPWTPIKTDANNVHVLGRTYAISNAALPATIETRHHAILAGPIELTSSAAWIKQSAAIIASGPDAVTWRGELLGDRAKLTVTNRIEFDGFMLIDLDLTGSATLDNLELVIPLKAECATLMQNYRAAPGPGSRTARYTGAVPDRYTSPPFITQWIGTDHFGLEFSIESSRGWAMANPDEAIEITREGERVVFRAKFITKAITLTDTPRHIRFALVATPTKTILPYVQNARFYDDIAVALLPYDWAGFPAWHPPMKDAALIAEKRAWVDSYHDRGQKLLVNGGWAVSTQDPDNRAWIHEMFSMPLQNVSYSDARQFAYCWNSPQGQFIANSFAHNANLLGFDGIRFDTVTPGYQCRSLAHGCAWRDDDGNLWPKTPIFAQREVWKRLYRTFHGGVIDQGVVYTPNASGPIMAIHSFSDHHEIGEGFYQKAHNLKEGYPHDMVRSIMTGDAYGFVTGANLKDGPLYPNERIAALLVNGAEPRFLDSRAWGVGYAQHKTPAVCIWDAWDWIDRYNADWLGWWENRDYVVTDRSDNQVLASLWLQPGKRALLVVTNYEEHGIDDLPVKLNLAKLGLTGPAYAEDAMTLEPVAIDAAGLMPLDVFSQGYRLIKVSNDPPRFRTEALSENLLPDPPASLRESWVSPYLDLKPGSVYIISADIRIDKEPGLTSENPNAMGRFSPAVRHKIGLALDAPDVVGVAGTSRRSGSGYTGENHYRHNYTPQWFKPTAGWARMFLAVRIGNETDKGRVVISMSEANVAEARNICIFKELDG